jgi:hypothetical protein
MNGQILPVSRGKNVRCLSNRYAISRSNHFGFVDSVPPFYLHKKQINIRLWAVELKYVFGLVTREKCVTFLCSINLMDFVTGRMSLLKGTDRMFNKKCLSSSVRD